MANFDYPSGDPDIQEPRDAAPSASAAERKTAEKWAEQKGLWPQLFPAPAVQVSGGQAGALGTVAVPMASLTGPRPNPEYWRFAAAKAGNGWPEGKELTEEEFDAAIKAAGEHVAR